MYVIPGSSEPGIDLSGNPWYNQFTKVNKHIHICDYIGRCILVDRSDIEKMVRQHLMERISQDAAGSASVCASCGGKRHYIVATNWKMNMSTKETRSFLQAMKQVRIPSNETVIIFPPYPYLSEFRDSLRYEQIAYGAQDCAKEEKGAYTGEVSGAMIADMGCSYTLIGHSERRSYYGDTPELCGKKTLAALKSQLTPVLCIGETLDERKLDMYKAVLKSQLDAVYKEIKGDMAKLIIAYEPVWAIGTGVIPTMEQIRDTMAYIHGVLASYEGVGEKVPPILYGGSVKPDNAAEIAAVDHVGGFLIGGAGLKVDSFTKIMNCVAAD